MCVTWSKLPTYTFFTTQTFKTCVCGEANFQNLQLTNFHNINFQNMCVRWSKLPICKLPKHKLPTGRLPTRKLHTTSYNFAQLHTTLHNFAGVEWSGELPICKLPKLKLPTCRLPTRKLHTKCVCGEANFQLTNFHNINFQNVCVWREANFQLTHFSQHKLSKRVCGEANFQNFQLTNFHNINFQKWRSISPCMSHGCQCIHACHMIVNVSMHVTLRSMSPCTLHGSQCLQTNFHDTNFQNMCVRWSKLPTYKLS